MDKIVIIKTTIARQDIEWIENKIRDMGCICSCYDNDKKQRYNSTIYLKKKYLEGTPTHAIIDRNLMSNLTHVAKTGLISNKEERDSIILLAFLRIAELEIEPGVSLAEYADSYHNPTPEAELDLFRKIDNIPSNNLLALAKGETSIVDIKNSSYKEPTLIKSGPKSGFDIHQWRMHYGYALKAYLLYHEKLKPLDYIKKYIFWMWKDYAIGSLSIPFIGALLSQNFSGIIKGINSGSTEKVIKGIKNAAWDMTLAHYWTNFVIHRKPQGPCLILCTQDKALKYITDGLTYLEEKPPINQLFEKIFQGLLKKPEIDKLVLFYEKLDNRRNASCRKVHSYKKDQNFFNTYISELELAALNNVKNRQGCS